MIVSHQKCMSPWGRHGYDPLLTLRTTPPPHWNLTTRPLLPPPIRPPPFPPTSNADMSEVHAGRNTSNPLPLQAWANSALLVLRCFLFRSKFRSSLLQSFFCWEPCFCAVGHLHVRGSSGSGDHPQQYYLHRWRPFRKNFFKFPIYFIFPRFFLLKKNNFYRDSFIWDYLTRLNPLGTHFNTPPKGESCVPALQRAFLGGSASLALSRCTYLGRFRTFWVKNTFSWKLTKLTKSTATIGNVSLVQNSTKHHQCASEVMGRKQLRDLITQILKQTLLGSGSISSLFWCNGWLHVLRFWFPSRDHPNAQVIPTPQTSSIPNPRP